MNPQAMIIPITHQTAFTLEESSLLQSCQMSDLYMFEFILAMWGIIDDMIETREDLLYEQLAADLGDTIVGDRPPENVDGNWFAHRFDQLYAVVIRLYWLLKPYLGRVPDGTSGMLVSSMTYHPFVSDASVLRFHVDERR